MRVLENYEPKQVLYYFEEISQIPRGSGNERELAEYCIKFANDRGLASYMDEANNVVIKKPGTKGKENLPPVILQGHLDMVCEKNAGIDHDFLKDPIKLKVDGDNITAIGTTLGADNGIAVAMMLALLDCDYAVHPPIECFFTSDEEVGMGGAMKFDYSNLDGKLIINLDSEEYGKILVSCAGGLKIDVELSINWVNTAISNSETYAIRVRGLNGGHSGADIHLERANSNKILGRTLDYLEGKLDYEICSISGGAKDNAIPREAQAYININSEEAEKLEQLLEAFERAIISEFRIQESNISIKAAKEENILNVFCKETKSKAIGLVMSIPNGVLAMSFDIPGLVETSNNLGVITMCEEKVIYSCAVRSSVQTRKQWVEATIKNVADIAGAKFISKNSYPGWEYNSKSTLQKKASAVFKELTGTDLRIEAIHAGLECGLFTEKISDVDIISFGPDMEGAHTPDEKVSISSIDNTNKFLLKLLEEM